jgi:hypothetical protein
LRQVTAELGRLNGSAYTLLPEEEEEEEEQDVEALITSEMSL